jgi:hypothetical protein
MKPSSSASPPRWTSAELDAARQQAIDRFRQERLEEPLEQYLQAFDEARQVLTGLLEQTADLARLRDTALSILTDSKQLEAFRYLAGPPISLDDLKTLTHARSLSPKRLKNEPDLVERVVETVRTVLDQRRCPWVAEERTPTDAERHAAVLASTALLATSHVETWRRNTVKVAQERLVKHALATAGLSEAPTRRIRTLSDAPASSAAKACSAHVRPTW